MHPSNRDWIEDVKKKHHLHFKNCKVLELGSQDVCGTIRDNFKHCEWWGIDKMDGKAVDVVCAAKDFKFKKDYFDTLISLSMFEHDTEWKESITNNLKYLKEGGLILFCWGAEGNEPHMEGSCGWELVKKDTMLNFLKDKVEIIDHFWEHDRYGTDCPGAYEILARK